MIDPCVRALPIYRSRGRSRIQIQAEPALCSGIGKFQSAPATFWKFRHMDGSGNGDIHPK